jgi:hypothetical protein
MSDAPWSRIAWSSAGDNRPRSYICGFCDRTVGPKTGYSGGEDVAGKRVLHHVYICSYCTRPTFFEGNPDAPVVMDRCRVSPSVRQ